MAIDRGGLRYTIEVQDRFSRQLASFRSQVQALKKELGGLRNAQAQLNTVRRGASNEEAAAERAQLDRLRRIQAGIKQQAEVEKLRARIFNAQRKEQQQSAREDIELFRRRKAEEARASAQRAAQLRREEAAQARANKQVRQGSEAFKDLSTNAYRTEGAVNRVSFTFRRLFGILAAFQAARLGAQLFQTGIAEGITFNQTIEDSTISLAALFSAAGRVSREFGGPALQGAEAFAVATEEARRQVEKLRVDALGTTATFQELLKAFQAGVGPGLEAGLNLDEIREVTQRVSQAAAALAVPQNQLIEEIRSLLRGTIQARTTIVASVLGISSEDIRKAKEAGNLFDFLRERLGPFKEAAEATQGSFSGLLARVTDARQLVAGKAAEGFFEALKNSLLGLFDALTDIDTVTGNLVASNDAVRVAKPLFDGLAQALRDVQQAASNINLDAIIGASDALGNALRILANLGIGAVQGLVQGVADLGTLFNALGGSISGLKLETLVELVRLVVRAGTVLVGLNISLALTRSLLGLLISPIIAVGRAFLQVGGAIAALVGTTKGWAIAITSGVVLGLVAAGVVLKDIINDFAGFDVKMSTFFRVIGQGFINLITVIGATLEVIFVTIFAGASQLLAQFISFALSQTGAFLTQLAKAANVFGPSVSEPIEDAAGALSIASKRFDEAAVNAGKAIAQANEDLDNASVKFFEDLNAAINDDADGLAASGSEVADSFLGGLVETLNAGLDGIFADLLPEDAGGEAAATAGEEAGRAFVEGINKATPEEDGALVKYFRGVIEGFENGLSLVRPAVQQLSNFISDSIVSAFDPTDDTDLLERFARFLQSLAKLIIQQLVQIAIARAALGLAGVPVSPGGGGAPDTGTGLGFAEGGEIPDASAPRRARPKGLDPRDTTPIWAQPGEFMMRLDAVKRYGARAMEAINRGLVDPSALNALLGGRSRRHLSGMSSRSRHGFAEGGMIRTAASAARAGSGRQRPAQAAPVPAVIVANNQTMDKLLAGGGQAFRRYLSDNASEIDGILRRGRTGG